MADIEWNEFEPGLLERARRVQDQIANLLG